MIIFRILGIGILVALLSGCGLIRGGIANFQSLEGFIKLSDDSEIYYEDGSIDIAANVKQYLPDAIIEVERKQFEPFKESLHVYVCASKESFSKYSGSPEMARGAVFNNNVYISPKAVETGTLKAILTHELSHLQFHHYLGNLKYASNIPPWFQEGLAVYASGGGGAEKVTYEMAKKSILSGHSFAPNDSGSLIFPRSASTFGLKPQMFYRQSSMFVGYLHDSYPTGFKSFMSNLLDGAEFKAAFEDSFGQPINRAWEGFIKKIKA